MANEVKNVNTLTTSSQIKNINTLTDAQNKKISTLEFTGTIDPSKISITNDLVNSGRSWGANVCYGSHLTDGTSQNQLFVTYGDVGNGGYVTVRVGTVSGDTITWGTEVELDDQGASYHTEGIYNTREKRFMCHYHTTSGSNHHYAIGGTITDKSVGDLGDAALVEGGSGYNQASQSNLAVYNTASDTMDCIYEYGDDANDGNHVRAVAFTDTTAADANDKNDLTVGSRQEFVNSPIEYMHIDYNKQRGNTVVVYHTADNTVKGRALVHSGTVAGGDDVATRTSFTTMGAEAQLSTTANLQITDSYGGRGMCWDPDNNVHHNLLTWNQSSGWNATIVAASVGTSNDFTWSSDFTLVQGSGTSASGVTGGGIVYNHTRNRIITYGATSTAVGSQYNFEYHTYDGSNYASQGSATTLSTLNGYFRGCGTTKEDTSAIHTGSFMVNHVYDGTDDGDGCRIYCMDPGG